MLFVAVPIVVLGPLEFFHETKALNVKLADFWVAEFPFHPAVSRRPMQCCLDKSPYLRAEEAARLYKTAKKSREERMSILLTLSVP